MATGSTCSWCAKVNVDETRHSVASSAQLDKTEGEKSKKDKITHVTGDKSKPAGESLGAMVELAGGLFRGTPGKVELVNGGAATPTPKRESGSLDKAGKMFEDWGKGTMVELHGMESVMRPQDVSKVFESTSAPTSRRHCSASATSSVSTSASWCSRAR